MNYLSNFKLCDFCFIAIAQYTIYKVVLETDVRMYEIGLIKLLDDMADWALKKMYHLSASQILLMRPDLTLEFFKKYRPGEMIVNWKFEQYSICDTCYNNYKIHIPVI